MEENRFYHVAASIRADRHQQTTTSTDYGHSPGLLRLRISRLDDTTRLTLHILPRAHRGDVAFTCLPLCLIASRIVLSCSCLIYPLIVTDMLDLVAGH
eukprot:scaffold426815_cov21-Prasinocladus_malaysianus.AAC.1